MASRTRYYLEQCIPELDDLVDKKLFTKNEVNMVMRKRTDFEHRLNSRGSRIEDYMRYIEYEKNVDRLRSKRVRRILNATHTNSISDGSIIRRIEFIYQRGVDKFPQDIIFWANYLSFLKSNRLGHGTASYKKIHSVYTKLLRLHPSKVDIWISAAKFEYEIHANFKSCRLLFQNALKFNPDSEKLWFEYTKFELNFITKLIARRRVMGLINEREQELDMLTQNTSEGNHDSELPTTGDAMKDKLNELPDADMNMLGTPDNNPALRGDIALTIFDLAMNSLGQHYQNKRRGYFADTDVVYQKELDLATHNYLYDATKKYLLLFDEFEELDRPYLVNHIVQYWKNRIENSQDVTDILVEITLIDILINIKYMPHVELDIDQLRLSVNKFIAYKSKLGDTSICDKVRHRYIAYLKENYLKPFADVEDPQAQVLQTIINKL